MKNKKDNPHLGKNALTCVCGKLAFYKKNLKFDGHTLDGWQCKSCGEEYYNPIEAEKILLINQLKNGGSHFELDEVNKKLITRSSKSS